MQTAGFARPHAAGKAIPKTGAKAESRANQTTSEIDHSESATIFAQLNTNKKRAISLPKETARTGLFYANIDGTDIGGAGTSLCAFASDRVR